MLSTSSTDSTNEIFAFVHVLNANVSHAVNIIHFISHIELFSCPIVFPFIRNASCHIAVAQTPDIINALPTGTVYKVGHVVLGVAIVCFMLRKDILMIIIYKMILRKHSETRI